MAGHDNTYSRLVSWLKIILPLAALAILSTMFLVAHTIDPTRAIPFAKVDVTELAKESRVSNPHYNSVTQDGSVVSITASSARPDPNAKGRDFAKDLNAVLTAPGGAETRVTSLSGVIDSQANFLTLDGDVNFYTSGGYHLVAPHAVATLDKTLIEADDSVKASGPMGTITADSMKITPDPEAPASYVLVFKTNVTLIYEPGS